MRILLPSFFLQVPPGTLFETIRIFPEGSGSSLPPFPAGSLLKRIRNLLPGAQDPSPFFPSDSFIKKKKEVAPESSGSSFPPFPSGASSKQMRKFIKDRRGALGWWKMLAKMLHRTCSRICSCLPESRCRFI